MNIEDIILQYLKDDKQAMKDLLTLFLNAVLQQEAKIQVGVMPYERSDSRKAHRNGYRRRSLRTKYGEVELRKPQIREFPFETRVFERYSRVEKALSNAIAESYIQGVSTRRMEKVLSELGVEDISPSSVSNMAKELDEDVDKFLKRPIEKEIKYLFVDATYFKVREDMNYISKALFIAVGVDEDGYRRVLGVKIASREEEGFWMDFFEEMKQRGLRGVKLVISDGHEGIKSAVTKSFIGSSWQMCHVHFIRLMLRKVTKKKRKRLSMKLKEALQSEKAFEEFMKEMESKGENVLVRTAEKYVYDLFNYKAFPTSHHRRIRTTNVLERVNKEIKRRTKEVGAFTNDASLVRLAVSILMNIDEEWITTRKYLNMDVEEDEEDEKNEIVA